MRRRRHRRLLLFCYLYATHLLFMDWNGGGNDYAHYLPRHEEETIRTWSGSSARRIVTFVHMLNVPRLWVNGAAKARTNSVLQEGTVNQLPSEVTQLHLYLTTIHWQWLTDLLDNIIRFYSTDSLGTCEESWCCDLSPGWLDNCIREWFSRWQAHVDLIEFIAATTALACNLTLFKRQIPENVRLVHNKCMLTESQVQLVS